ncbi:hypothetical protein PMI26_04984 [Pseudomonas sp. GM33]|uniref:hypothetical protein n=1 Tax=Pseudomonas sp. GM33 TaxID=1144329 RepID=UPI00027055B1|nr:hypothetical protein [Pseudomonas sp. GM33]EJM37183.1 hypothetical protein PMI26_04984 [Pseudomonas sp. GM33]
MNLDEIQGRNLIKDGRFSSNWKTHWTHFNGKGIARVNADPDYGFYLIMNGEAAVTQTFYTAPLTTAQLTNVEYRLSFQYENYNDGLNSKVIIKTTTGLQDEIDLSGKIPDQPQADWNPLDPYKFGVVEADMDVEVQLHGSSLLGSSGLRITDIDVQLHLAPLRTRCVQVDDRVYVG